MNGLFEGLQMQKPESINEDNLIYFVISISAFDEAEKRLSALNNTYVLADFRKHEWIVRRKKHNKF